MATCLVTGGAGFIGSHLVDALVRAGHAVRVLDDLSSGNLADLASAGGRVEFVEADVCDLDAVRRATRGADLVFHLAALTSIPRSVVDPLAAHQVCATGTLHVLTAALEADVRRIVYAGSSSVYGAADPTPSRETDPSAPLTPYAVAKLAGEQYCRVFGDTYGLETVCLRYFNVFGPRQRPGGPYAGVVPLFIDAALDGTGPVIFGDGSQVWDFTPVEDAVRATVLAATTPGAAGKVYNVGTGRPRTLVDLVAAINASLGTRVVPTFTPPRVVESRHCLADISAARTDLGYEPVVGFEEGLRRCAEHQRSRRMSPAAQPDVPSRDLFGSLVFS